MDRQEQNPVIVGAAVTKLCPTHPQISYSHPWLFDNLQVNLIEPRRWNHTLWWLHVLHNTGWYYNTT